KQSIKGLVAKLGFPPPGPYTQEWDCEVADASRCTEWLSAYEKTDLNDEEKFTLMKIIVESLNDVVSAETITNQDFLTFRALVVRDYDLHKSTVDDWADWEQDDLEDSYAIAPLMRKIIEEARIQRPQG
ncbi:MAG: hypothetical protein N2C14_12400, partial [Planctomycetales bacterium]